MTRVQFLFGVRDRHQAVLAWLADAWRERRKIVVFAPDADARARLDQLLWSQPATGFLPHCAADDALADETPVLLAGVLDGVGDDAVLVNLADDVPPGFTRFEHLVEIISRDETVKAAGRERFRHYRARGYPIESVDLSEVA